MQVLVVYNFEGCQLGLIEKALNEVNAKFDVFRAYIGERLPEGPDGYDAILVLGGTQSALSDKDCPWQPHLVNLLRAFVDTDRSVLGICLGCQLLARAFGGQNTIGAANEFGWTNVALTEQGRNDPLFANVDGTFPIFQWHDDTFTLPKGATHLACNAEVANQAFRIGRAAYGVQFHFEAGQKVVAKWSKDYEEVLAEKQPHWAVRHGVDEAKFGAQSDAAGLAIARNWVRSIRSKD